MTKLNGVFTMTNFIRFLFNNKKDIGLVLLIVAIFFGAQIIFGGC